MRVGLMVGADQTVLDVIPEIQRAESAGFSTVWTAGRFDALTQLAIAGPVTRQIELGTGVVSIYQRHPAVMAQQALTVQSASGGRHVLGLGVSHRFVVEGALSYPWRPIGQMREYLSCLRPLMDGTSLTFAGKEYAVTNYRLPVADLVKPAPSVLVAALGPQMLRVTGRLADGTIIFLAGLRYLREVAIPTITGAAAEAGRPAPRIVAGVPVCVTDRPAIEVRDTIRPGLSSYDQRPSYRAVLDRNGSATSADVAIVGDEVHVRAVLADYEAAGVTDFLASISSDRRDEEIRTYEVLASVAREAGRVAA